MSNSIYSYDLAVKLDNDDPLRSFRQKFNFPQKDNKNVIYFCGNSLGLQPKIVNEFFESELQDWGKYAVDGHHKNKDPWFNYQSNFSKSLARIVGAKENEVVAMNSLTVNLHLLLISFYKPTKSRFKIIMEAGAFSSDQYAIETQVQLHGFDPKEAIIEIKPRDGEHTLRDEDIIDIINKAGDELSCVMLGAVNYYTGQWYNMQQITQAAHKNGSICGFDLAHAIGNVPMELNAWNVDFACWCSYKYLNSGPGGVGGIFVHEHHGNTKMFRLAGWWGNDEETRFDMIQGFKPVDGASGWQMSNAPVFNMVGHKASLSIFDEITIDQLREKSLKLTSYLEELLLSLKNEKFKIITPSEPEKRGAQLSLLFCEDGAAIFEEITGRGVVADWRKPNVIRIAPVPLYNSFEDVYRFYEILKAVI